MLFLRSLLGGHLWKQRLSCERHRFSVTSVCPLFPLRCTPDCPSPCPCLWCNRCTYGTVWHGAITRGRLRLTERVLITGASGGVGTAAVQICAALGCHVIAVTSSPAKVDYLKSIGAQDVVVTDPKYVH